MDLTGRAFGRFRVLGIFAPAQSMAWVVRCACGNYETRKAKEIKNPANAHDCCRECRQLEYLKRREREIGSR